MARGIAQTDLQWGMSGLLRTLVALSLLGWPGLTGAAAAQAESRYTPLTAPPCVTIKVYEPEGSTQRCPGLSGYGLLVEEGDLRSSVTVVAPGGRRWPLEYWSVITDAFSSLGPRAEWRGVTRNGRWQPSALIVRVSANEDVDNPSRLTSYLAVAKITPGNVCVTARIGPGAQANVLARQAADRAASQPCLKK